MDVIGHKGSTKSHSEKTKAEETQKDERKVTFLAAGGVHNPTNALPAGEELFPFFNKKSSHPKQLKCQLGSAGCFYHS